MQLINKQWPGGTDDEDQSDPKAHKVTLKCPINKTKVKLNLEIVS